MTTNIYLQMTEKLYIDADMVISIEVREDSVAITGGRVNCCETAPGAPMEYVIPYTASWYPALYDFYKYAIPGMREQPEMT